MSSAPAPGPSTAISCLVYRDARGAIEWLCRVIGFERHQVYEGPDKTVAHAELKLGGGMIMIGTVKDSDYGRLIRQPDEIGGAETQSVYVVVPDADAVHQRAVAAGAKVALPLKTEDYGGRGCSFFDPEGHLWNVGTYNPWSSR